MRAVGFEDDEAVAREADPAEETGRRDVGLDAPADAALR